MFVVLEWGVLCPALLWFLSVSVLLLGCCEPEPRKTGNISKSSGSARPVRKIENQLVLTLSSPRCQKEDPGSYSRTSLQPAKVVFPVDTNLSRPDRESDPCGRGGEIEPSWQVPKELTTASTGNTTLTVVLDGVDRFFPKNKTYVLYRLQNSHWNNSNCNSTRGWVVVTVVKIDLVSSTWSQRCVSC